MTGITSRLTALFSALMLLLIVAPTARGQEKVDEEIQALKDKLATLENRQIEMKKGGDGGGSGNADIQLSSGQRLHDRGGGQVMVLRTELEAHFRMGFESGPARIGRTSGEIMGRRLRPYFYFCKMNCFYELEVGLDLDGFGTGNAKNSTNTGGNSILQRGALHVDFEQLNPWLPTFDTGMDISTTGAAAISRQNSSNTGVQREYDLMTRNVGPNTGRAGQGINLRWDDRSLEKIGIPGRISRLSFAMAGISEGDDGLSSFKDAGHNFDGYIGINPFNKLKNKWLRGLLVEFGWWACGNRGYSGNTDNGCTRVRMRDHGDQAKQTLFDTGSNSVGKGWYNTFSPGIRWVVGPIPSAPWACGLTTTARPLQVTVAGLVLLTEVHTRRRTIS